MTEAEAALDAAGWGMDWAVGTPLMVATVVVHVIGLGLIRAAFHREIKTDSRLLPGQLLHFAVVMSVTVLLVTMLHALQAGLWAATYILVGARPTLHEAMLYSIGAMTTYGHAAVYLDAQWQLLGAMEALIGAILLGLSTAFLYGMIEQAWPGKK